MRMMIAVKKILLAIIVLAIGFSAWYRWSLRAPDASSQVRERVKIEAGTSVRGIARILEEKGVIRSATVFGIYARLHKVQADLKAGDYFLTRALTVPEVVEALREGKTSEIAVTIPEGYTVKDIDTLLASKGLITAGQFTACARTCDLSGYAFLPQGAAMAPRGGRVEGYLFPDTYFVITDGFTAEAFLKRLLDTFKTRVVDGLKDQIGASKRSLPDIVTMASLIEEETRSADERPVVSGILWKRHDAKMGLGVDAAVRYILDKPSAAITVSDLDTDSPYNLRKFRGLPPGPIASPGMSSLRAAAAPEDSEYWFYLHGTDGKIHYAVTNDEHNQNRAKYLR